MKISQLLALHESYTADHSHADILGDPFLLKNNFVYRNLKSQALKIGGVFKEAWPQYLVMPFAQLTEIVSTQTIPYVPSAKYLRSIENKRANTLTTDDLTLPVSYHMHEAAHVIAEDIFKAHTFETREEQILRTLMCESFANSVDAFAWLAVGEDEPHAVFLQPNCYMRPSENYLTALSALAHDVGPRRAFELILLSYIFANFLREEGPQELFPHPGVWEMADSLDLHFREQTTQMHLNLEGHDGDVYNLTDFDFMKIMTSDARFLAATRAMSQVVAPA